MSKVRLASILRHNEPVIKQLKPVIKCSGRSCKTRSDCLPQVETCRFQHWNEQDEIWSRHGKPTIQSKLLAPHQMMGPPGFSTGSNKGFQSTSTAHPLLENTTAST